MSWPCPQDRAGRFQSELFERYQRSEKALVLALQQLYLQGVSTREVKAITESCAARTFSESLVSSVCQALDTDIDARYEHVRENHQVVGQDVRDLLTVAPTES